MTCHNCRIECKTHGKDRKGNPRYQCRQCRKAFSQRATNPLDGMYVPVEKLSWSCARFWKAAAFPASSA